MTAKPGALRRPVSSATYLEMAELERLDDTSNARLVRVVSSAVPTDRQPKDLPEPSDRDGDYLLIVDLDGQSGKKICDTSALASSEADLSTHECPAAEVGIGGVAHGVSIRLRRRALESRLVALTRVRLGTPVVFEPQLYRLSEDSAPVDNRVQRLLEGLKYGDSPETIAGLEEDLLTTLLTCCKHNYSLRFREVSGKRLPRHVKLVEDYIFKNAEKPISMKDLENITEVSARSIHHAFRRFRGYSPKALLQAVRLDRAHKSLLEADPSERVMTIAVSCGFVHLGRFSAAYKKRFGELPSQTLGRK